MSKAVASADPPVRIFVGGDRSQMIGVRVLEYSIRRHTQAPVELTPMIDLPLPQPSDPKHRARTGFSFSRFVIPKLAGYRGRALYLDADMQVFRDIMGLWAMPFGAAKVICQTEIPKPFAQLKRMWSAPKSRIKQTSVMLLDCGRLDWKAEDIIAGLGGKYTYEELMQQLCILNENDVSYKLPFTWNSLEHYDETTCLLHYTDMPTQPWVSPHNPNGWLWRNEVRRMLADGSITRDELEQERGLGFLRPSFFTELVAAPAGRTPAALVQNLAAQDAAAAYVAHASLNQRLSTS